ncbi:MAG: RES family NAD+ phosphorylase [Gammaproteobacteria bacterium]|nr:RES family NAD+ phosphorylase [Gammaproteobacteria bacterium]
MLLYRIAKKKYLDDLSGIGTSYKYGGRWNYPGHPVVYFAISPAIALLEMGNYLGSPRHILKSMRLGTYEIDDSLFNPRVVSLGYLNKDWRDFPYPDTTQSLGSEWLKSNASLFMAVPSCAVPASLDWDCCVMNPLHPDRDNIRLVGITDDIYNDRLFKNLK